MTAIDFSPVYYLAFLWKQAQEKQIPEKNDVVTEENIQVAAGGLVVVEFIRNGLVELADDETFNLTGLLDEDSEEWLKNFDGEQSRKTFIPLGAKALEYVSSLELMPDGYEYPAVFGLLTSVDSSGGLTLIEGLVEVDVPDEEISNTVWAGQELDENQLAAIDSVRMHVGFALESADF